MSLVGPRLDSFSRRRRKFSALRPGEHFRTHTVKVQRPLRWRHNFIRRLFSEVRLSVIYLARFLLFFRVGSERDWDLVLISVEWSHHYDPQNVLSRVWPHPQRPTLAPGESGKGRRRGVGFVLMRPSQSSEIAGKWLDQCKLSDTPALSLPVK